MQHQVELTRVEATPVLPPPLQISKLYRLLKAILKYPQYAFRNIFIHPGSTLGLCTTIGAGTRINGAASIDSSPEAPCKIGKYCAIAQNLCIRTSNHHTGYINLQAKFYLDHNFEVPLVSKGPVIIGNNVWIGDNVTILSGVRLGDGAVIGSGAVVTKDVPPFCIAVGVPAKVVKKRFSDSVIKQLMDIKWWDWTSAKIERNRAFFATDFSAKEEINLSKVIV
ncbi:MAG: CatB-related O-acetyltransferase [Cyanobacteria bacterium J06649_4]